uniref:Uncharacterized protein n=1 Tax=Scophthalmus maximus TaxID=52904 RepID=A0A8D3E369_SCOMX
MEIADSLWKTHTEYKLIQAPVVWTSTVIISLLVGSCHAQKLNVHWGPQSMMYLKGKCTQRRQSHQLQKPSSPLVSSENVLVQFLEDR